MSKFYLTLIILQFLFVLYFARSLRRVNGGTTFHYVLCVLMAVLYGFEFYREVRISLGATYFINEVRFIVLRIEHTLLGMFLMEVIHHAKILY